MEITYHESKQSAYVQLKDGGIVKHTKEIKPGITYNLDEEDNILGIYFHRLYDTTAMTVFKIIQNPEIYL